MAVFIANTGFLSCRHPDCSVVRLEVEDGSREGVRSDAIFELFDKLRDSKLMLQEL